MTWLGGRGQLWTVMVVLGASKAPLINVFASHEAVAVPWMGWVTAPNARAAADHNCLCGLIFKPPFLLLLVTHTSLPTF